MSVLDSAVWDEEEPSAPGGGRMRYKVETIASDDAIPSFLVHISEQSLSGGHADHIMLTEADLSRMIRSLQSAQVAISRARGAR